MSSRDKFLESLRATFKVEAEEHLQTISNGLRALQGGPAKEASRRIVEGVFRAAHSLKGAAHAVNLPDVEARCQVMEDRLASWMRRTAALTETDLDWMQQAADGVAARLSPRQDSSADAIETATDASSTVAPATATPGGVSSTASVDAGPVDTVRVPLSRLHAQLLASEELLTIKLGAAQRSAELQEMQERVATWKRDWAAHLPEVHALRRELDTGSDSIPAARAAAVLELLDRGHDFVRIIEQRLLIMRHDVEQQADGTGKQVDDLLEGAKRLLLLPFASIATAFPQLVREACREQGKHAELMLHGELTELDSRTLEEIKDPLNHLLRNAVVHGIEPPSERRDAGKPERAQITLTVTRLDANQIELVIADDGGGIDTAQVARAAISQGMLDANHATIIDDAAAHALIFESHLSTSPRVTNLAGRGLGLAIVREHVERLGGSIGVDSVLGSGTRFRVVLPATRATLRVVVVECGGRLLVLPSAQVDRVGRVRANDIRPVRDRETIALDGRTVPLVELADALELGSSPNHSGCSRMFAVLGTGDQRTAFAVDAVVGEQEVLLKPLRKPLLRLRNVAAVTVLGSGIVAPILHVSDLLKTARRLSGKQRPAVAIAAAHVGTVLVAEDSITSRLLLKAILEAAGYQVKTAADGVEAFTLLRAAAFDVLVSDVEMPRLNGFDLTAKIRADRRLQDLPVVLVTARETREDRERGFDVGANAYIAKGSFDQNELVETLQRLV